MAVIYGGLPVQKQRETLKNDTPHIVVGCPGRVMQLVREGDLKVDKLQYFVLDECDKMLDQKGENGRLGCVRVDGCRGRSSKL